jgi:hypothetical protein
VSERKHIYSKANRVWPPSKIPNTGKDPRETIEAFAVDHTRKCSVCGNGPVVNGPGLCGPCTWGEWETQDGNW